MSNLEDIARRIGAGVGSIRGMIAREGDKIKAANQQRRILENFLLWGTKNPYVARILVSVVNNSNSISIEEAIDNIRQKGIEGVIGLLDCINAADVWSAAVQQRDFTM